MMMVVVMGIWFPVLVDLTWPPGPTDRSFPGGRPVGLPAPRGPLLLLVCLPGRISLILVAHGWDLIRTCSSCLQGNSTYSSAW